MGRLHSIRPWMAIVATTAAVLAALPGAFVGVEAQTETTIILVPGQNVDDSTEGNPIRDQMVAKFTNTNDAVGASCSDGSTDRYSATIDWGDRTSPTDGTVTCETLQDEATGVFDVSGSHTYNDSNTPDIKPFDITVTVTGNGDDGSATSVTAQDTVADAGLHQGGLHLSNDSAVEGDSVGLTAEFLDDNPASNSTDKFDKGLSATVDWGDGSISNPTPAFDDCSDCETNVLVTASHVYDARSVGYTVKVTLNDDGGQTASQVSDGTIKVTDAALAAGGNLTLSELATKAFTATLGTFTDAAGSQATPADFAVKINWGDRTTSNGNVTQTAPGKFSVSGTHTYGSVGPRQVTVTITDEEGSTLGLTAEIDVGSLPLTGQPEPTPPSWPAMLLTFGGGLWFLGSFLRRRLLV